MARVIMPYDILYILVRILNLIRYEYYESDLIAPFDEAMTQDVEKLNTNV